MSFTSFDLGPVLSANLNELGFSTPTPIQRQSIEHTLKGHDVLGLAQTGTGKTAAYVLPVLKRLMDGPRRQSRALVLCPTRELAEQIHEVFMELGQKTGLHFCTLYGGASIGPQIHKLRIGTEILVACPGRLLDHVERRTVNLSTIETLVLDEADRMFDMGFLPDIRRIIKCLPQKRQTLLFSATMPDDVRKLAHEILHNPVTVQIENTNPPATVTHALYNVAPDQKTSLLLALLEHIDRESVLVFTKTRHKARRLAQTLSAAGHKTTSLQGNLTQGQRKQAMTGFRDGKYHIMVATDIASRGLDVASISHVINYDMPATIDDYVHRIGRTGRAAKNGDAFTFVTREDESMVRAIERKLRTKLERKTVPGFTPQTATREAPSHDRRPEGRHHKPRSASGSGSNRRQNVPWFVRKRQNQSKKRSHQP